MTDARLRCSRDLCNTHFTNEKVQDLAARIFEDVLAHLEAKGLKVAIARSGAPDKSSNTLYPEPVVLISRGGRHGGTTLTPLGRAIVSQYRALEVAINNREDDRAI